MAKMNIKEQQRRLAIGIQHEQGASKQEANWEARHSDRHPESHLACMLRRQEPGWTLKQIGDFLGISREAVRQRLKAAKLRTRAIRDRKLCLYCNQPIKSTYTKFCSKACRIKYAHVEVTCFNCGKAISMLTSQAKARTRLHNHIFCGHRCCANWLKQNTNFGQGRTKAKEDKT